MSKLSRNERKRRSAITRFAIVALIPKRGTRCELLGRNCSASKRNNRFHQRGHSLNQQQPNQNMSSLYARGNAIIPFTPSATHVDKEGYLVDLAGNTATISSSASIPAKG